MKNVRANTFSLHLTVRCVVGRVLSFFERMALKLKTRLRVTEDRSFHLQFWNGAARCEY